VRPESINKVRELLIADQFFQLEDEYGERVPDSHTKTVSATVGRWTKTVKIHSLKNWADNHPEKLSEPARALHTYNVMRSWFSEPGAADTFESDNAIMRRVKKGGN
jgi:hypothetical protein